MMHKRATTTDVSEIVKHYRGDMPYRTFAKMIGVSHQTLYKWELGTSKPTHKHVNQMAQSPHEVVRTLGKYLFMTLYGETLRDLIK